MEYLLSKEEMQAVINGDHGNVFAVLGIHRDKGSKEVFIRAYQPNTRSIEVLKNDGTSLGMMTINALAATDGIVVPTIPQHLPTKGIEKLLESVHQVRRGINPSLKIEGILMTLVDGRTVYEREISEMIRKAYGGKINIFGTEIPRSVRAAETSAEGKSIFAYAPRSKVAEAYRQLTKEVLALEKQREEHRAEIGR